MNGYCATSGKVRFESAHKASLTLRTFDNGGKVYRCDHCHDWHVTHGKAKDRTAGQRRRRAKNEGTAV